MQMLLDAFPKTFYPQYDYREKADTWQRFNLASDRMSGGTGAEWKAWRQGATIDPVEYNEYMDSGSGDPRLHYAQRQLLTTVNNSDELARMQSTGTGAATSLSLKPGALKYYLGRITDTTMDKGVPRGAFLADGSFNDTPVTGEPYSRGAQIIYDLADYYHEMLLGHDWGDEYRSAHHQAYMLAVNTVAFAAPRRPNSGSLPGAVDVVSVVANDAMGTPYRYSGYAPQPFITQVMAYKEAGKSGGYDTALAVELYNPNDRAGDPDEQALYLPQFAVSINDSYEGSNYSLDYIRSFGGGLGWANLPSGANRMDGRSFWMFIINDGVSNTYFEGQFQNHPLAPRSVPAADLGVAAVGNKITVKLWRTGLDGFASGIAPVLVDEFEIEDPNEDSEETWNGAWVDAWRDTNFEEYIGVDTQGRPARWRCVLAAPEDSGGSEPNFESTKDNDGKPDFTRLDTLSVSGPGTGTEFGPSVPLYTMNANLGFTSLHGVDRPSSFPTAGFLLYVPRFSHMMIPGGVHYSMGRELYRQFDKKNLNNDMSDVPADFGHMPIFDNQQDEKSNGTFDDTGKIPWGLLAFDYFTTWNIDGDDGIPANGDEDFDPYRIPGRININVASWYVLAGLPVIGPNDNGDLPLATSASPAFWSEESNVLVGTGTLGQRYPEKVRVGLSNWTRLGEELAQSAAAYRDRVQYVSGWDFAQADDRNESSGYRVGPYGTIRGQGGDDHGFLSIGELANVMGFDGSSSTPGSVLSNDKDFMKATSLLALLDTHFLTTRSNTFTTYVTLIDREEPQASLRSQITLDRTNLLPRRVPQIDDSGDILISNTGKPETIGRRQVSYFNARHDE